MLANTYTAEVLIAEQASKIEETMWTALRMFEERKNLLNTFAGKQKGSIARNALERAKESQKHIDRIRQIIQADDKGTSGDIPE
ncbi:MAG TPA: hypothetical protein VGB43_08170 [Flavobacterium sp.]